MGDGWWPPLRGRRHPFFLRATGTKRFPPQEIGRGNQVKGLDLLVSAQLGMASVAEWLLSGVFASAPCHGFSFRNFCFYRGKGSSLVGTVTERLVFRLATTAPVISAGLDVLDVRALAGNDWITHGNDWSRFLLGCQLFLRGFAGRRFGVQSACMGNGFH